MAPLKLARVRVAGRDAPVLVPLTSSDKPSIPKAMGKKWEEIVNLIAEIVGVPSSLIMRLGEEQIEVFLKSESRGNPYEIGETAFLQTGLYCETVVGRRERLLVPDARLDPEWAGNPDIKLNMVSYLGFPLVWPDGEIFGTICVLDNKRNEYEKKYIALMERFRAMIEQDLSLLLDHDHIRRLNVRKDLDLREVHHRIKNNFSLLVGYLRLKSRDAVDISALARDIEMRIQSISMIHEKIHKGEGSGLVNLRNYVRDLLDSLISNLSMREVRLKTDVTEMPLPFDALIPIGLILNELVSNSIRHAFADCPSPEIRLNIEDRKDGSLLLDYRDNGKGFPEGFDPSLSDTLGLNLIRSLAEQMNGRCVIGPGREAAVLIEFRAQARPVDD